MPECPICGNGMIWDEYDCGYGCPKCGHAEMENFEELERKDCCNYDGGSHFFVNGICKLCGKHAEQG